MKEHPIVVYGATGYTGRLICEELRNSGTRFAMAGRNRQKLEALQTELSLRDVPLIAAGLDDTDGLRKMAQSTRVVLSCAGPFSRMGRPVQDAALAAGSHYLDITGEYPFMLDTYRRDEEARQAGVALVNSVGFDVVPTDTAAALASEALGGKPERVRIAFALSGAGPSQGTLRSMLTAGPHGQSYYEGRSIEEPLAQHQWEAPLPPPFGRRSCVSVPWGDVATAPRTTGANSVQVFVAAPPALAPILRMGAPLLRALSSHWLRDLLTDVMNRGLDLLPEGPTALMRSRARSGICAEAVSMDGTARVAWVTAGDSYAFTAASAALCARLAAADGFAPRGALTPTQAFGARALLDGLKDHGVDWGIAEKTAA